MLTIAHLIIALSHMFDNLGAHHYYSQIFGSPYTGNGYVASKHWLIAVCRIPAGFGGLPFGRGMHHTFVCMTTIRNGVYHVATHVR